MEENKQLILDLLLKACQATRGVYDLLSLEYDEKNENVIATFKGGKRLINVSMDSGFAMIKDVVNHLGV